MTRYKGVGTLRLPPSASLGASANLGQALEAVPFPRGAQEKSPAFRRGFSRTRMSDPHGFARSSKFVGEILQQRRHPEVPRSHQRDEGSGVQRHSPDMMLARSFTRLKSAEFRDDASCTPLARHDGAKQEKPRLAAGLGRTRMSDTVCGLADDQRPTAND